MTGQTNSARLYALSTAPTEPATGECDTHGVYHVEVLVVDGDPLKPECPRCLRASLEEIDQAERAAVAETRRRGRRKQRLAAIGLPPKLLASRFEDYCTDGNDGAARQLATIRNFANRWDEVRKTGENLALCGWPGTGKTMLASIMCKQIVSENDAQPLYTTVSEMLRYVRGSYNKQSSYTETQAIERFGKVDLLVIDEMGVKLASDFERSALFEIVDLRYRYDLPTVIISNLSIDELSDHTSERLVERLVENGTLMVFDWDSHRGKAS